MKGLDGIRKMFQQRAALKKRPARKPVLKSVDKFENILVISTENEEEIEKVLPTIFIHAKIIHLTQRQKKTEKIQSNGFTIHSSDLSLTGIVKNDKLREVFKHQFDLIIDLSDNDPMFTRLIEQIETSFLIGRTNAKRSLLYDLAVDGEWTNKELIPIITEQIKLLSQHGKK
jgi:hypothetical protein